MVLECSVDAVTRQKRASDMLGIVALKGYEGAGHELWARKRVAIARTRS
jgi:hypothetical protein